MSGAHFLIISKGFFHEIDFIAIKIVWLRRSDDFNDLIRVRLDILENIEITLFHIIILAKYFALSVLESIIWSIEDIYLCS